MLKYLPLFILLAACSHVRVVTPNPRVEVPETRGDALKWKFGVAAGDAHMFEATQDGGSRPADLDHPEISGHADVYPAAYFLPHQRVEIGAELDTLGSGINALAKWQILGEGTSHALTGNIPVAIFMRTGLVRGGNDGDQKDTFGDGGYDWRSEVTGRFLHGGVSVGYRVSEHSLLYGGVAIGQYWTHARVTQDAAGTDPGGTYNHGYSGNGQTAAIGAMWNWRLVQFYVSGEYTHVDYGPTNDMEDLFLNTGVTFTPGAAKAAASTP